ncbi:MAG: radical SAM protein [Alphaproteobacteria bacterium]|nr:radical SAM protein [Alphaproteobacteria bacterium]
MSSPPLGLCRAAAWLAGLGCEVAVFDFQASRDDAEVAADRLAEWRPDLVVVGAFPEIHLHVFMGVSAAPYDIALCRAVRRRLPGVRLGLGGYLAGIFPRVLGPLCPEANRLVTGPDDLLAELHVTADQAGFTAASALDGLAFLRPGPLHYGIDRDLYLTEGGGVRPVLPALTATGCPYRCSFCATPVSFGHRYTPRPLGPVIAEIRRGVRHYGVTEWSVWDDTLTVGDRAEDFSRRLIAEDLGIRWWCFAHADRVLANPEMLPLMRAAGCRMVWIGGETPDPDRLRAYGKRIGVGDCRAACRMVRDQGMLPTASFLIGEIGEDRASLARKREEIGRFVDDGVVTVSTLLIPVPGTALFSDLGTRGLVRRQDLRLYSGVRATLRYDDLSAEEVEDAFLDCYLAGVLPRGPRGTWGRANLWSDGEGRPREDLERLARAEYARLRKLEEGPGERLEASWFHS